MQLEHLVGRGPDAPAVTRQLPGLTSEEARQSTLVPARSLGHRNQSARWKKRADFRARALTVVRHSGGGAHPPPLEPPTPLSVDLRRVAPIPERRTAAPQAPFRFWVDELLWSQGRVAVELLEAVLTEAGGVRTGGPSRQQERELRRRWQRRHWEQQQHQELLTAAAVAPGPTLGSGNMDSWDVLWTKSTYAIPAARSMRPGQLVSAIIGLNCLTMKKRLLLTLREALGPEAAFTITPRSFALPEEIDAWEDFLRRQQQQYIRHNNNQRNQQHGQQQGQGKHGIHGSGGDSGGSNGGGLDSSLWILKTGQDAGKGLSLLPADLALKYARERQQGEDGSSDGSSSRRFQLQVAQQYIINPFLILGRKFHLRLWLLVTCHCPLRAYLHRRGLVLFSAEPYNKASAERQQPHSGGDGGGGGGAAAAAVTAAAQSLSPPPAEATGATPYQPPASHITNYARNNNTLVWGLHQLAEHLGPAQFGGMWEALRAACGRTLAAAAPLLAEAHDWLRPAVQEYGFQVLGVDFLLDERLRPWLLEFNSAPSIMVQHEDDATCALVHEQKYGMLRDTWEVVRCRVYPRGADAGQRSRVRTRAGGDTARWEVAHAGEYEPLMPYIP